MVVFLAAWWGGLVAGKTWHSKPLSGTASRPTYRITSGLPSPLMLAVSPSRPGTPS